MVGRSVGFQAGVDSVDPAEVLVDLEAEDQVAVVSGDTSNLNS